MLFCSKTRNRNKLSKDAVVLSSRIGSTAKFVQTSLAHQKLPPLQFSKVPRGYWMDEGNQRNHLNAIGRKVGVKEMDDWYNVPRDEVNRKASFITRYYSSL